MSLTATAIEDFKSDDTGAVSVDWIVLTGAMVGIGVATSAVVGFGVASATDNVDEFLTDQTVESSFGVNFDPVAFFEDFENGLADGWSVTNVDQSEPGFGGILGPFGGTGGGQMVFKSYDLDPDTPFAVLEFDIHAIDTWDMEKMMVFVDDLVATERSFSTHSGDQARQTVTNTSDPNITVSYARTRESGEYGYWDRGIANSYDETMSVRIVVTDPGDQVKLGFGSTLNQSVSDESWAVDNVRVVGTDDPEST